MAKAFDINGREVLVGSKLRVLRIDKNTFERLSEQELNDVRSMLDEVFEVYEIDEYGCAWVEKWWDRGNGESECHCLSLDSESMRLVKDE